MADQPRAVRNLAEDINHAHQQLRFARRDGNCDRIQFWIGRRDELLERWAIVTATAEHSRQGTAQ